MAILGEIPARPGPKDRAVPGVFVNGSVAYVSQEAWIFSGTVQENILFGAPLEPERYRQAVRLSMLHSDLKIMPGGDQAEIGEKGVNLSGGQKQRVSLARAIYKDADVYLFDDPLSALDSSVSRRVFEGCIQSHLRHKTRVLVTNDIQCALRVDRVLVLSEGRIVENGPGSQLAKEGGSFSAMVKESLGKESEVLAAETDSDEGDEVGKSPAGEPAAASRRRMSSIETADTKDASKLLIKEERETGSVRWPIIKAYMVMIGGLTFSAVTGLTFVAAQVVWVCVCFFYFEGMHICMFAHV
jgi:ABC-type sulfate/molybdate transport systems ATPase subunit